MKLQLTPAKSLIYHLMTWGEVTRFELSGTAGTQDWITIFEKDINNILDGIEINGYRLIDSSAIEISEKFNQYRKTKYYNASRLSSNSLSWRSPGGCRPLFQGPCMWATAWAF